MTKDELISNCLDAMTNEYYSSNLCQMMDNPGFVNNTEKMQIEGEVYELLDDLANCVVEMMEEENVLRKKEKVPA